MTFNWKKSAPLDVVSSIASDMKSLGSISKFHIPKMTSIKHVRFKTIIFKPLALSVPFQIQKQLKGFNCSD